MAALTATLISPIAYTWPAGFSQQIKHSLEEIERECAAQVPRIKNNPDRETFWGAVSEYALANRQNVIHGMRGEGSENAGGAMTNAIGGSTPG